MDVTVSGAGVTTATFTTNAKQDAALAWYLTKANAERAAMTPPKNPFTDVGDVIKSMVKDVVDDYLKQADEDGLRLVDEAFRAGNAAKRTAIKTAAGV